MLLQPKHISVIKYFGKYFFIFINAEMYWCKNSSESYNFVLLINYFPNDFKIKIYRFKGFHIRMQTFSCFGFDFVFLWPMRALFQHDLNLDVTSFTFLVWRYRRGYQMPSKCRQDYSRKENDTINKQQPTKYYTEN